MLSKASDVRFKTSLCSVLSTLTSRVVLCQVSNDGYKSLDRSSLDDVLSVGASCTRDLYTVNLGVTQQ